MLQTQRLTIRELLPADLNQMHALNSIPEVDEFNTLGIPESIETTRVLFEDCIGRQHAIPRVSYVLCIELLQTE